MKKKTKENYSEE